MVTKNNFTHKQFYAGHTFLVFGFKLDAVSNFFLIYTNI